MLVPPTIVVQDLVLVPTVYPNASLYILAAGITLSVRVQASRGCVYGVKSNKGVRLFSNVEARGECIVTFHIPFEPYSPKISYVWPCPRSIGLALFYISRYLIFIDQPLTLYGLPNPPSHCPLLILAQSNFLLLLLRVLMFVPHSSGNLSLWPIDDTFSNA